MLSAQTEETPESTLGVGNACWEMLRPDPALRDLRSAGQRGPGETGPLPVVWFLYAHYKKKKAPLKTLPSVGKLTPMFLLERGSLLPPAGNIS